MITQFWKKSSPSVFLGNPNLKKIKISFCDFWPTFDNQNNYLVNLLQRQYFLEITDQPDFIIYSVFGNKHKTYQCTKIFFTGENVRPDFSQCDYAFTFDYLENDRHFRLPLYGWWADAEHLIKTPDLDVEKILASKTNFCNFIYGNPNALKRIGFFNKLSEYKQVDSGGTLFNNIGRIITESIKVDFIKDYKFTIAFENCEQPGYTTEKLVQPMLVYSLPIYWGNSLIDRDFNTRSFLNYYDFESEEALIQKIIELDQNDELYLEYLRQPYYNKNRVNDFVNPDNILEKFRHIFEDFVS